MLHIILNKLFYSYRIFYRIGTKYCRFFKNAFFIFLILINISLNSYSQQTGNLKLIASEKESNQRNVFIFQDSSQISSILTGYLNDFYKEGYLTARFDSTKKDSSSIIAYFYKGNQIVWGNLSPGNIDDRDLNKANINFKKLKGKPLNINLLQKNIDKLLELYENTGYPFASITLKNVEFVENTLNAELFINKYQLYRIDTFIVEGYNSIKPLLLNHLFNIRNGELYSEYKIKSLSNIISSLEFLDEIRPAEIEFTPDKASLYAYLKKRNANRFSGVAGIMPNSKTTGKLLLTGEINLFLINLFKHAEKLSLEWQKLELSTQSLNIAFDYPYLFQTNFATEMNFSFYKKDTSYLNIGYNIGIKYLFSITNSVGLYIKHLKSNVINYPGLVTGFANYNSTLVGINYHFSNLDNRFNPRHGIETDFSIADGKKTVKDENDSVDNKIEGLFTYSLYFPLFNHLVTRLHNHSGFQTGEKLYDNELFLMGGIQSFRGIEEKSILASAYSIFSLEFRYIFEKNSNLFIFTDAGKYQNISISKNLAYNLWSIGIGTNLYTKSGIFSLTYAINKPDGRTFELRSAKIHIGYINRF